MLINVLISHQTVPAYSSSNWRRFDHQLFHKKQQTPIVVSHFDHWTAGRWILRFKVLPRYLPLMDWLSLCATDSSCLINAFNAQLPMVNINWSSNWRRFGHQLFHKKQQTNYRFPPISVTKRLIDSWERAVKNCKFVCTFPNKKQSVE